jgi:septum formation protein
VGKNTRSAAGSNDMKIILGSASTTRQKLFQDMGYDFEVVTADIDEKSIRTEDYHELPLMIARAKADALMAVIKEPAIIITADVIAVFEGRVLEKPKDAEEARATLRGYANKVAEAVTGVVVINTQSGELLKGTDVSKVYFKEIPDNVIDELIKKGNILSCAGSFEIKDPLVRKYIDRIDGTEENVAGLPIELVRSLLKEIENKSEKKERFTSVEKKIR